MRKFGLNDEYEEYVIHDYEMPVPVSEYTSIGELNRLRNLYLNCQKNFNQGYPLNLFIFQVLKN